MIKFNFIVFCGVVLALIILYVLELNSSGAITLLVFMCIGVVSTIYLFYASLMKNKITKEKKHNG